MGNLNRDKKIFCIGFNKTGTTSLASFMHHHGFSVGNQQKGELLIQDYAAKNWGPIIDFCQSADFFQDLPFSTPGIAPVLDKQFPNSLFILTKRKSAETWYNSLVNFHKKVFSDGRKVPRKIELMDAKYRYKGFAWDANRALYNSPETSPYEKSNLISTYNEHIENTRRYFEGSNRLLELEIENPGAIQELCSFLGIKPQMDELPWLNKTSQH